jgi:hypothetical protein
MLWNGNECGKTKAMRISRQPSLIQIRKDEKQQEDVNISAVLVA